MTIHARNVLHTEEKKIKCPVCGMISCLEEQVGHVTTWLCVDCGYNSNTTYKNHSSELKKVLSSSPQIVLDLKKFDTERNIWWFPTILNMPSKGIVYPEGKVEDWCWVYSPIVDVPEKDRPLYPVPGKDGLFYEKRLAIEKSKKYGKNSFFVALKDLGAVIDFETEEELERKAKEFAENLNVKEKDNA